ncbi:MAG: hypothetical protein Q7K42_05340 [Candidatus Diapherotrites archaeon]|nr:hypothetical protein [Candidatus Diapherotrites archaeon]
MNSGNFFVFAVLFVIIIAFAGCVSEPAKDANADVEKEFQNVDDFLVKTGNDPSTFARNEIIKRLYDETISDFADENVALSSPELFFYKEDYVSGPEAVEDLQIKPEQLCLMKGDFENSGNFELKNGSLVYSGSSETFSARVAVVCGTADKLQERLDSYTNLNFSKKLENNSNTFCGSACLSGSQDCCTIILRNKNS